MQHLTEEQLVLLHYRDLDDPAAQEHLASCAVCCTDLDAIRGVLAMVDGAAIPERGEDYGAQVWNVLRWKLGSSARRATRWLAPLATAAVLVLVFLAGGWWHARTSINGTSIGAPPTSIAQNGTQNGTATTAPAISTTTGSGVEPVRSMTPDPQPEVRTASIAEEPQQREPSSTRVTADSRVATVRSGRNSSESPQMKERILLLVIGDHFESSERMLVELANANPKEGLDISSEQKRSEELLASNRLYRQTATRNGDRRVASVLDDLEPLLMQIANSPSRLSSAELGELQKRIEAKGILFKVRVIGSQSGRTEAPAQAHHANTL
jgi:hypothetical protein